MDTNTCVCFHEVDVIVNEQKTATDACICYPLAVTLLYAIWLAVIIPVVCGCVIGAMLTCDLHATEKARRNARVLPVSSVRVNELAGELPSEDQH